MRYLLKLKEKEEEFLSSIIVGEYNLIDNLAYTTSCFLSRGEKRTDLKNETIDTFRVYMSELYQDDMTDGFLDALSALHPNVEADVLEDNFMDYTIPLLWKALLLVGLNDPSVCAVSYQELGVERGEVYSDCDIDDEKAFEVEDNMREEGYVLADYAISQTKKISNGYRLLESAYEEWEKDKDSPTLTALFNGASTMMSLVDDWEPLFLPYDKEAIQGVLDV